MASKAPERHATVLPEIYHGLTNDSRTDAADLTVSSIDAEKEMIINGVVYDVSAFVKRHPGGKVITYQLGSDASDAYNNFHLRSKKAAKMLASLPSRPVDADYEKDGWATTKAILMSKAMRKITNIIAKQRVLFLCASQLREKMGVMFGDKYTTSGGKALGFHASCRVRLKGVGKLKSGSGKTEQIIGVQTEAQVIKNRMGPPFKKATFDIYFNSGINDYGSWLAVLKDYGAIKGSGAYYTIVNEDTGEEIRFMSKDWRGMLEEAADFRDYCYRKLCNIYIMKYKDSDLNIPDPDDLNVDDGDLLD
jgi:predicted heme/steroid binding protein